MANADATVEEHVGKIERGELTFLRSTGAMGVQTDLNLLSPERYINFQAEWRVQILQYFNDLWCLSVTGQRRQIMPCLRRSRKTKGWFSSISKCVYPFGF